MALLNGMNVQDWCIQHGKELPGFVLDFARELQDHRAKDAREDREGLNLAEKLKRSEYSLQYWLNCIYEREHLDELEQLLLTLGMQVCSYECDGLLTQLWGGPCVRRLRIFLS